MRAFEKAVKRKPLAFGIESSGRDRAIPPRSDEAKQQCRRTQTLSRSVDFVDLRPFNFLQQL